MIYSIRYRTPGSKAWETIKDVKGDAFLKVDDEVFPVRIIIREDETQYEINHNSILIFEGLNKPEGYEMTYDVWYLCPEDPKPKWEHISHVLYEAVQKVEIKTRQKKFKSFYFPIRIFTCANGQRYELPMNRTVIKKNNDRFRKVHKSMEKDAGQKIPVNSKLDM